MYLPPITGIRFYKQINSENLSFERFFIFCTFRQPIPPTLNAISNVRLTIAVLFTFTSVCLFSQTISAFKTGNKWGFKKGQSVIIEPQYDSVFGFDETNQICLIGNIDPLKRSVNSLTKQVRIGYTFNYINSKNQKFYFKPQSGLDSVSSIDVTKQSGSLYLGNSDLFIAAFSGKKMLWSKKGKQVSSVKHDNINFTKVPGLYTFEESTVWGLMDESGKPLIGPTYSKISINVYDSVIYCCTAGSRFNGMDDVYNYKGEKIHTSGKHIQSAGKNYVIYRLYDSENAFIIHDLKTNTEKNLKADFVYYLRDNKMVILADDWFFYDLKTEKKAPMDKTLIKYMKLDD